MIPYAPWLLKARSLAQNRVALYGVALMLVSGTFALWRASVKREGALEVLVAQHKARGDSLDTVLKGQRVQFQTDTVRLFRRVASVDTVLQRLIDTATVTHTDTVRVPVTVLVQADSTIKACRETVRSCAALVTTERARGDNLADELRLVRRQQPSVVGRWLRYGVAAGVGYLAATVTRR